MLNIALKKWQRSWGTALALLALLAWCMPALAMGCAMNSMPSAASLHCSEMSSGVLSGVASQQMPCCQKIPVPRPASTTTHPAVFRTDGHVKILIIAFSNPHAPLWALLNASPNFICDASVKPVFPAGNFSPPPSTEAPSSLLGRAPPSLI